MARVELKPGGSSVERRSAPQCEGSGRVTVSAEMALDIRPYKPKEKPVED